METFSALLALCAGNSPVPVNSPHKGQWRGALMFCLISAWINGWLNNREAGGLRRNRAHYDVNVMLSPMTKKLPGGRPHDLSRKWFFSINGFNVIYLLRYMFTLICYSSQHGDCWWPGTYLAPGHQQQTWSWWRHQREHFPRHCPLWVEFTGQRWIPLTKASDAELWCWSAPERMGVRMSKLWRRWWVETPLRSLWRHCTEWHGPVDVHHEYPGEFLLKKLFI